MFGEMLPLVSYTNSIRGEILQLDHVDTDLGRIALFTIHDFLLVNYRSDPIHRVPFFGDISQIVNSRDVEGDVARIRTLARGYKFGPFEMPREFSQRLSVTDRPTFAEEAGFSPIEVEMPYADMKRINADLSRMRLPEVALQ